MNLGLGTVQFGMSYGISNRNGQTSHSETAMILGYAREAGLTVIDTAYGYGESEAVLGTVLLAGNSFRIITKTPAFPSRPIQSQDAEALEAAFRGSLAKLGTTSVAGLLVHNADDLLAQGGDRLYSMLVTLKESGKVEKIGTSVYTGEQIDALLDRFTIDIVQLPVNVLDQRLVRNGRILELKRRGIEVHSRSVFLQGILLMAPEDLHPYFDAIRPHLARYHVCARDLGLTVEEAAFCYISGVKGIDHVIIGVNRLDQLVRNVAAFRKNYTDEARAAFGAFAIDDPNYVNPSLWRLHAA